MMDKKVVIIGAGLVGSLLAVMLRKKGFPVTIYEKRSDMRKDSADAGRSINLIVTSRGINALRQVDLWDKVKEITVPVFGRMMHDQVGELTYQPYGRDESECNFSVSRGGINKLLMTEAESNGAEIIFNSTVSSIHFENKELVVDSQRVKYDLLFGADGGGSVVRKELMEFLSGDARLERFSGDYKEMLMPATDSGDYPIEKNALHIWPRGAEMLMALPNQDGSFTMTLYMPAARFSEVTSPEQLTSYFQEQYKDSIPLMPDYHEEFFQNPQGFLGTVRCAPWVYENSVCLMGDAAHAIVPFFGQGMNLGFEDCYYLMKFFEEEKDWQKTFQRYNQFQKPNAEAIADMALENAIEMSEKVGDKNFLFKKHIERKIESEFPQEYRARYGMVTYTLIPYADVFAAGEIQKEIIDELAEGLESLEQLDMKKAKSLIDQKLRPFITEKAISLDRYNVN